MIMGEAKRREELGLPPRQKKVKLNKSDRYIVFAWSYVNNKINIGPTKKEKIIVKPTTSTISLGR